MWQIAPPRFYQLQPTLTLQGFSFSELGRWNLPETDDGAAFASKTQEVSVQKAKRTKSAQKPASSPEIGDYTKIIGLAAFLMEKNLFSAQMKQITARIMPFSELHAIFKNGFIFGHFISQIYRQSLVLNDSQKQTLITNNWKRIFLVLKEDVRIPTDWLFDGSFFAERDKFAPAILSLLGSIFSAFKTDLTVASEFAERLFNQQSGADAELTGEAERPRPESCSRFLNDNGLPAMEDRGWKSLYNFQLAINEAGAKNFELPYPEPATAAQKLQNATSLALFLTERRIQTVRQPRDLLTLSSDAAVQLLKQIKSSLTTQRQTTLQGLRASQQQSRSRVSGLAKDDAGNLMLCAQMAGFLYSLQLFENEHYRPCMSADQLDFLLPGLQSGEYFVVLAELEEIRKMEEDLSVANLSLPGAEQSTAQAKPRFVQPSRGKAQQTPLMRFQFADTILHLQRKCQKIGTDINSLPNADITTFARLIRQCFPLQFSSAAPCNEEAQYNCVIAGKIRSLDLLAQKYQTMEMDAGGVDLDLLDG